MYVVNLGRHDLNHSLHVPRHEFSLADQALTAGAEQTQVRLSGKSSLSRVDENLLRDSENAAFMAKSMRLAVHAVDIIDQEIAIYKLLHEKTNQLESADRIDYENTDPEESQPSATDTDSNLTLMEIIMLSRDPKLDGTSSTAYVDEVRPIVANRLSWLAHADDLMPHVEDALQYAEIDPLKQAIEVKPGPTQIAFNGLIQLRKSPSRQTRRQARRAQADIRRSIVLNRLQQSNQQHD